MFVDIFPHLSLDILLELKTGESPFVGIFLRDVLRIDLHDDSRVGELPAAGGIRHPVHDDGLRLGLGRDKNTARTHAEREHATVADLLRE